MVENLELVRGNVEADQFAYSSGVVHTDGYGGYKKLYGNQILRPPA